MNKSMILKRMTAFNWLYKLGLILVFAFVITACGPAATTEAPQVEATEAATDVPEVEPTDVPEVEPTDVPEVAPTDVPEVEPTVECPNENGTVFFFAPAELSGAGSTVGNNWRDGATIAIEEINAEGGLLGCQIEVEWVDTQSDPAISKAVIAEGLEKDPYVILGPLFSGSIIVNMVEAQRAEVFQIMGGEAANLTQQGNPYIFRTSFGQSTSMPKLAAYLNSQGFGSIDIVYTNNDFGQGGREAIKVAIEPFGITVVNEISVEEGQADFAPEALTLINSESDAVFIYSNEEESARLLEELQNQGNEKPLIGETVLIAQSVIDLAGDAANGAKGHVGLSAGAPMPLVEEYAAKFEDRYGHLPDHNGMKGYIAVYVIKAITERMGEFDTRRLAEETHCTTITTEEEPGVLIDIVYDEKGDVDRESFLAEVVDGLSVVTEVLPRVGGTCGEP